MSNIPKIKDNWDNMTPSFRNKVSKVLNSRNEKVSGIVNPFLDKAGKLVNPYINYQKILDENSVSAKAKGFIEQATGLSPAAAELPVSAASASAPSLSSGSAASSYAASSGNRIVNAAENYIGTPYVWGGESMSEGGMDCSGFVYNALKDAGYKVGRTTAQGYRSYGTSVSKADMQPGDLVFFGKNGNASHIGIYIGNGQMIHSSGGSKNTASNPGKGVSVANVDYRSDFLEARRY